MTEIPTSTADGGPTHRVVIVDDTEDQRELLGLALARGGFEIVGEAGDGSTGIEIVRRERPDVVLLDLAMPVMDGIEALPAIRRLVPAAKIVVLSGFGAQQMAARAVAEGADGYVQKGSALPSILDYVRHLCEQPRPVASLSVVGEEEAETLAAAPADHPAAAGAEAVPAATGGAATPVPQTDPPASLREAVDLAPYGVLELADDPLFRIRFANPAALALLGSAETGAPLASITPALASLVSYHRVDEAPQFTVDLPGGAARASLRRTGWSVLVYLDPR